MLDFSSFSFQMWPSFNFKVHEAISSNYFLNIKSVHNVIRLENVLEKLLLMREMSLEQNLDYQEEIRKVFQGVKIITKYNNQAYKIKDIVFEMNTENTFNLDH